MSATGMAPLIRVLVADDHPVLRSGVIGLIQAEADMRVVAEAGDGRAAVEAFRASHPDVVVMDLQMPQMDGVEAIVAIRAQAPQARIIVLTMHAGDVQAVRALKSGAAGFVVKSSLRRELIDAIRLVHAGERHVPADVAIEIAKHIGDETLSERELAVLALVAEGTPNRGIAVQLAMSEETVKGHMKRILAKLSAQDRTHAVAIAIRRGMLTL